jgi:hypothetical protein
LCNPSQINTIYKTFTPNEQEAMKDIAIKIGKELKEKLTLKQRKMSQCGEMF